MEPKDKKEFVDLMMSLGEIFEKVPSIAKTEIYYQSMKDLTIEEISRACSQIINTRKITGTFPLPAEIRELTNGNIEDRAYLAWDKLNYALNHLGFGNSIAFDDKTLMAAIQLWAGSWRGLRNFDWEYDQIKWLKKDFVASYKTAANNQIKTPEYFPGDFELDNERKGLWDYIPKPYLVGGLPGRYFMIPGPKAKQLPDVNEFKRLER